ncbi:MAG: prepilin-type N-terminal cleavage/methylation domain-containing protein [Candidatus Omnitrophica bacterium]|nr:prepilin-type N-terminal cleavage/methylation domain-containing protein [Candidatus Omnitrophota bacterium]
MKRHGFTLVEILVVLVVIGILISLVIPNALRAIDIANTRSCANNIRTLDSAIQLHFAQNRTWPTALDDLCPFLDAASCTAGVNVMVCPVDATIPYTFLVDANNNNSSIDRGSAGAGHFATFPDTHN